MKLATLERISLKSDCFQVEERTGRFAGLEERELAELRHQSTQIVDRAQELLHIDDLFVRYESLRLDLTPRCQVVSR